MVSDLAGLVISMAPILGLLVWRGHMDRRQHIADVDPRRRPRRGDARVPGRVAARGQGRAADGVAARARAAHHAERVRAPDRAGVPDRDGAGPGRVRGRDSLRGQLVSTRMLAVITPGDEATALAGFAGLMSIARAAGAEVRVAYVHDLPKPRVDRHDRIVADTDAEMARIEATATQHARHRRPRVRRRAGGDGGALRRAPARGRAGSRGLRAADRGGLLGRGRNAEPVPRVGAASPPGAPARRPPAAHGGAAAGRTVATPRTATPRASVGRAL